MTRFKPGDKVWVDCAAHCPGNVPPGTYAVVLITYLGVFLTELGNTDDYWEINVEELHLPSGYTAVAGERIMRPRFDPPPQQEPKQERQPLGNWNDCHWRPKVEVPA